LLGGVVAWRRGQSLVSPQETGKVGRTRFLRPAAFIVAEVCKRRG